MEVAKEVSKKPKEKKTWYKRKAWTQGQESKVEAPEEAATQSELV